MDNRRQHSKAAPLRSRLGRAGEDAALRYLLDQGQRLLARNWRAAEGEIDLIMQDGDWLCFVEVRARSRNGMEEDRGHPLATITGPKQRQILRVARRYLQVYGLEEAAVRFDAVGIVFGGGKTRVSYVPNAFQG